MYFCNSCQNRFESYKEICERVDNRIDEFECWRVCPLCGDDDYIKLVPCEQCSDLKEDNGDKYCESCTRDVISEIAHAIIDLKKRYDAKLVDEALTEWIESL
jgi:hypothetical protein